MIGTTRTGFEFQIEDDILNDWEVVEQLVEIEKGNVLKLIDITKNILGEDQYSALKDHLRARDGKVETKAMSECIADVITFTKTGKN